MTFTSTSQRIVRSALTLLACMPFVVLAGCSQDFASVDDVHVPVASDDRFPIQVMDKPVKMSVSARTGHLAAQDKSHLASFAMAAQARGSGPVSVSYPARSKKAAAVSQQAVSILRSHGVPPGMIRRTSYDGKSDLVSLSFTRTIAATHECGDWSKNLGVNGRNEPYPDFGCSYQNNFAAMVKNPEDFERPRTSSPAYAAGRLPTMEKYQSGAWTAPQSLQEAGSGSE